MNDTPELPRPADSCGKSYKETATAEELNRYSCGRLGLETAVHSKRTRGTNHRLE